MSNNPRPSRSKTVLLAVLGLLLASLALTPRSSAAPLSDPVLELTPTWRAIGIEARYAGGDNVRAELAWRFASEDRWHPGVVPVVDPRLQRIWASVGPLEPGKVIEVRLTIRSDGADPVVLIRQTQTRQYTREAANAPAYWVRPDGNDANPGTSAKPFATIARAARAVKPGDVVHLGGGTYREANLLTGLKGEPNRPICFLGEPGKPVILEGGIDIPRKADWQHHGGDHYSIAAPAELTTARYAVQEGQRLFLQSNPTALTGEKRAVPRAWALDEKPRRIHVRTGGKPATDLAYTFAVRDQAFLLSGSKHILLRGLTVQHYGGVGIRISEGAEGCTVEDCVLRELPGAFFLKSETTRFNCVRQCEMVEPGLGDYPWDVIKTSEQTRQGVFCVAGRGNCFYDNRLKGWFDAIAVESWKNPDKLELNRDVDVSGNTMHDIGDDAIEADGGGINMRLWNNSMRKVHTALSLAPVERGPVWVARNEATFHNLFFKLNVTGAPSAGWAFCDHNTGVCLDNGPDGGTGISLPPAKEVCRNKVFRNNVMIVNEWSVRGGHEGITLDGNVYWPVPGKPVRRFQWDGKTIPTLDAFRKATGQETNGQYVDPKLKSPFAQSLLDVSLRLNPASPCRDRGIRIPGINNHFQGAAPDAGAWEYDD